MGPGGKPSETGGAQGRAARPSILIVDDNLDDLKLMAQILRGSGYEIRMAKDSTQALRSATAYPPELIVLDIMMPGMNGLDACGVLKSREDLNAVPVVFVTGLAEKADKIKAFAMGGVDYITKPYDPDEVLMRIEWHVRNRNRLRDLEADLRQLEQKVKGEGTSLVRVHESSVKLSDRESDCLVWLARGLRNDVIADKLGIKPVTVEMHIANARRKLAAATREQALVIAIQLGLVKP